MKGGIYVKKYTKMLFAFMAAVLTFVATTSAANACSVFFYQPELPEALRD